MGRGKSIKTANLNYSYLNQNFKTPLDCKNGNTRSVRLRSGVILSIHENGTYGKVTELRN